MKLADENNLNKFRELNNDRDDLLATDVCSGRFSISTSYEHIPFKSKQKVSALGSIYNL